ncbi:MAG: hypothetical protein PWR03_1704 [Tenuifilum sp.]|jgi:hypothetical protein|uniref:hypothetical protein n=1 Tax=Tenuifilum sp. TaxID=2760880 RepID=UPI0024AC7539|nr:hypothetical protein [Tenuifilum sp.]MDI3527521.1 hypothetical protein [Tenuifilum sp.]
MIKVNIKCIFPFNYFLFRQVSIYVNNSKVNSIGNTEEKEIYVPNDSIITFKLDLYRHTINVSSEKDKINILIYFKFRNYFPFSYLDFFRRKALQSKELPDNEFESAFETTYNESNKEMATMDNTSNFMALGLSMLCLYSSVFEINNDSWKSELSFLVSIVSIISIIILHVDRKKLFQYSYTVRIITIAISLLITGLVINLSYTYNFIFLFISSLIILRIITYKRIQDKILLKQ